MSGEELEVEAGEGVEAEEVVEELKPTVDRAVVLAKVEENRFGEAIKQLVEYVDFVVADLKEKAIAQLVNDFQSVSEVVKELECEVLELKKAVPEVEFSKEDRSEIIKAFSEVHKKLGEALSTLSSKEIGYKTAFNSKRGFLTVRLFKLTDQ